MQDLITMIKSYRRELLDYTAKIQRGVENSLPLIDATLEKLDGLGFDKCPFCSASAYSTNKAMRMIKIGLEDVFDLPDTWPAGGFVSMLSWINEQDEGQRSYGKTEWICSECGAGKLADAPDENAFQFHWTRSNLPKSRDAVASRILDRFSLATEVALSCAWHILYDNDWYVSIGPEETFVEKWKLAPKELVTNNGPIPGHIYLLCYEDLYKIGRTTQKPEDRIAQISAAMPFETIPIHIINTQNCIAAEQYLHDRFLARKHKGEWFRLTEEDVEWIKGWDSHIEAI